MPEPEEITVLEQEGIKVTNLRAIIGDRSYPLADVTSAELRRQDGSSCFSAILVIGGVVLTVVGIVGWVQDVERDWGPEVFWVLLGAGLIALGVTAYRSLQTSFAVRIESSSGESKIMESQDQTAIQRIVDAINEAIVKRG